MSIIQDTLSWLGTVDEPITNKEGQLTKLKLIRELVTEELDELEEAINNDDKKEQLNALVDAQWIINNMTFYLGLSEEEMEVEAYEVANSNFSKFCTTEEEATESVIAYGSGTHPNKMGEKIDCFYIKSINGYYAIRRHDMKILKSINFKE